LLLPRQRRCHPRRRHGPARPCRNRLAPRARLSPVRVLHVLDHSLPVHSGYAFRSNAILQAQVKRGGEARAVTSPKHGESWTGASTPEESVRGITYYRTQGRGRSPVPMATEWRLMAALSRRLGAITREWQPEIIHAHSPILNALPALRVGRRTGRPVVYEMRSLWEEAAVDHGSYARGSWKYRLIRALETRVCRAAGHVVVISEGLKADLSARGVSTERMTVVPNRVHLAKVPQSAPDTA